MRSFQPLHLNYSICFFAKFRKIAKTLPPCSHAFLRPSKYKPSETPSEPFLALWLSIKCICMPIALKSPPMSFCGHCRQSQSKDEALDGCLQSAQQSHVHVCARVLWMLEDLRSNESVGQAGKWASRQVGKQARAKGKRRARRSRSRLASQRQWAQGQGAVWLWYGCGMAVVWLYADDIPYGGIMS